MSRMDTLRVSLFSDGADLRSILEMYAKPWIRGFTTNPTLMRKAGVRDYEGCARALLEAVPDRPISFEVFAEGEEEMERQALTIATWGANVNVKIPVTDRAGKFLGPLIRRLSEAGVALNVTAILTQSQVERVAEALAAETAAIVSVFAGRIADTGIDPVPMMREAKRMLRERPRAQLLWASPRELLNIFQADAAGCDIITVAPEILRKLELVGKDLTEYSLETVEMFHRDAQAAGYRIDTAGWRRRSCDSAAGALFEDDFDRLGEPPRKVVGSVREAAGVEKRA
ncbi:MAG: transaldolase [Acidobacteriaceae bacterium]